MIMFNDMFTLSNGFKHVHWTSTRI